MRLELELWPFIYAAVPPGIPELLWSHLHENSAFKFPRECLTSSFQACERKWPGYDLHSKCDLSSEHSHLLQLWWYSLVPRLLPYRKRGESLEDLIMCPMLVSLVPRPRPKNRERGLVALPYIFCRPLPLKILRSQSDCRMKPRGTWSHHMRTRPKVPRDGVVSVS